jgi:hypothetical protein
MYSEFLSILDTVGGMSTLFIQHYFPFMKNCILFLPPKEMTNEEVSVNGIKGIQVTNSTIEECIKFFLLFDIPTSDEGGSLVLESLNGIVKCHMKETWRQRFTPQFNTLSLHLYSKNLQQEILWAMLISPVVIEFKNLEALGSMVRIRENIVRNACKTALTFETKRAKRPPEFWRYEEQKGFILLPHVSLIDALIKTTQPGPTEEYFDFSCYRATEYVILLSLAQESVVHHPDLFNRIQNRWRTKDIRSAQFHMIFLNQFGSEDEPLPLQFFIPGDRIWFKNPHEPSSNVSGYEGSWVFYIGGGLFSNFWKKDKAYTEPFTLDMKCIYIYHWRDGLQSSSNGELLIDEEVVKSQISQTLQCPSKRQHIVKEMMRIQDLPGVYRDGGCLDRYREVPKQIHPSSCELSL